ncbi:Na+/H+ antiporter [Actinomycetospora endophytica]|uniref:Na+/H+ antiporter n=1 Tax=Actinomycetospora endophytica TaxID=2291215 RepID=A0ABS8P3G4_9PSEU|nr:Na+/H+ antiporter [Actinomycetospora endophytica]MCD2192110.1 Na+/H+ antiporter [Actinomycetospora endophytica]
MNESLGILLAVLVGALAVTVLARKAGVSPPLALVVVFLGVSFIPGMPEVRLDPDLVLPLVLAPLLYSAGLQSSPRRLRENLRPIGLLAVGLVLFTAFAVGIVAWWLLPGLPLVSALILGAIVAPPDAVAAASIGRRLGLQRRVMAILEGESLLNDATALTLLRIFLAAAGVGAATPSVLTGLGEFVLTAAGGVVVGAAIGWLVHRIRLKLNDAVMESALGLVIPFATYVLAEDFTGPVHASGVLAVVVAGLYLGHKSSESGFASRLQDQAVWAGLDTVLEAFVFALIGLQLVVVVNELRSGLGTVFLAALAVLLATVLARIVWVFPTTYLTRLVPKVRQREKRLPWRVPAVISWSGMRGVVTLAAAFAVPDTVAGRDVIIFLAFVVTVGTLLLHGLTLPWLIRKLRVYDTGAQHDALEEAAAKQAAAEAAMHRLDEVAEDTTPEHITSQLRSWAEQRANGAWERLGRPLEEVGEAPTVAFSRLRREMLAAERETFVRFRDQGRLEDGIFVEMLRELDHEEAMLER